MAYYPFSSLLSASVPSDKRDERFIKIKNAQIQIEEAVIGLSRNIFQAGGKIISDKRKGRQLTIRESYLPNPEKSLARTLDDFLAPIKTRGADMMPQMNLASRRLDSQRRAGQRIMRTMHTTLGWGFLVLMNSHN